MGEYGISQPVPRFEDTRLLTGRGHYTDDGALSGQVHGYVLRSPHSHARLKSVDTAAARAAPGVLAILTGADYRDEGLGPIPHIGPPVRQRDGSALFVPPFRPLAAETVRFVGDGVAFVVAETLAQARDAAELVEVDYEPLPSVTDTTAALDDGAPVLWPEIGTNEAFVYEVGDKAAADAAFENAAHVVRKRLVVTRALANAMEPRAAIAVHDAKAERFTLWAPIQHPFVARRMLAGTIFHLPELQVHVITENVGGSFGIKAGIYPEYILCMWAARRTGRPVRWVSERSEGHISDFHARDNISDAELALDADGKFLGFRLRNLVNIGGYFATLGSGPATNNLGTLAGVYTTPASFVQVLGVFTNTHPTAPYRGAGRPEAAYVIERMVDLAADELGIDPVELRRRNMIPPEAMPYKTALTFTYDSGAFEKSMDDALALGDHAGFEARRAEAAARGRLRGLGLAYAIERAGPPGLEFAEIRFDPSGNATVLSGTTDQGQGHETTYIQVVSDQLGLDPERIRVVEGDTDRVAFGFGSGGSRSSALGTAAILAAGEKVIEKGRRIAAHVLEAAETDIAFVDGRFAIAGTDRGISFAEMVGVAFDPARLPPGVEPGLYESATYKATVASYPNGCHICEVEVDPETGVVEIERYAVVDDFGTLLNPLIVKGQVHGGVAQGAGQALMEGFVYDRNSGQVITGSFMDYCMPRADDLSYFEIETNPVPTATNPLGVKGAGEAGTVGALPVVINAVVDALAPLGIRHLDMPASPERVWRAIREAQASRAEGP